MPKVLIVYHSVSGNTKEVAEQIRSAIESEGVQVTCKPVGEASPDDMLDAEGIILGTPTYYGQMSAELKKFIDESVRHHSKLDGKAGGAFATAAVSGHETAVISILEAMLVHGMIVQGNPSGCHYGVATLGNTNRQDKQWSEDFGRRFAALVKRLNP